MTVLDQRFLSLIETFLRHLARADLLFSKRIDEINRLRKIFDTTGFRESEEQLYVWLNSESDARCAMDAARTDIEKLDPFRATTPVFERMKSLGLCPCLNPLGIGDQHADFIRQAKLSPTLGRIPIKTRVSYLRGAFPGYSDEEIGIC